jgi:poly-gamma-glutamate synthesis protein (capsule biosynthesis protein)
MTMLGWVQASGAAVVDVGFVPCKLRPDGRVYAVDPNTAEGREVVEYVERCNRSQKLNGKLVTDGAPLLGSHRSIRVVPIN